MSKRAKRKQDIAGLTGHDSLKQQQRGDENLWQGVEYEVGLRCVWMLELRGTKHTMNFSGEDCCIKRADGTLVYRQVKKNETRQLWVFKKLEKFLKHAYARFSLPENRGRTVEHEFYTNTRFTPGLLEKPTNHLNPSHGDIAKIAGAQANDFCRSVVVYDNSPQPNPKALQHQVDGKIRELLEEAFDNMAAFDAARPSEIYDVSKRLILAERKFRTAKAEISWSEVDGEVQFESLIAKIRERSDTGGSLISWEEAFKAPDHWLLPDAAEGLTSQQVISRPSIEEGALSHIRDWASRPVESPLRLVLLAGPHGSGKTWSLMRLGGRIASDYPDLKVRFAPDESPPQGTEFSHLGMGQPNAFVVLIDELLDISTARDGIIWFQSLRASFLRRLYLSRLPHALWRTRTCCT